MSLDAHFPWQPAGVPFIVLLVVSAAGGFVIGYAALLVKRRSDTEADAEADTRTVRRLLPIWALVLVCACRADSASPTAEWIEPSTGMVFVAIPAGTFTMGSPVGEAGREARERAHAVVISRPFWMGKFEVTQDQWHAVTGTTPSRFTVDGADRPVERVNWFDIQAFIARFDRLSPTSRFRLPTEAEWEYACRAGTSTPFGTGAALTARDANVVDRPGQAALPGGQTVRVGSYPPNAWGLHDMHGNVWEWVDGEPCPYPDGEVQDPNARCGSPLKVIRGGSWYFGADSARCALRYTHRPVDDGFSLGFRLVREAVE